MKINAKYELPVSEENLWLLPIIAKELGHDGVIGTPEEYIISYFEGMFSGVRDKVESGLNKYFGDAGKDTTKSVLSLYDTEVIKEITIE